MFLPSILNSLDTALKGQYTNELLVINDQSSQYGLVLTPEDAMEVIEARARALKYYGRIEMDIEVTKGLIVSFCNSVFLNQDNYVSTLNELHEVFYYLKNETEDKVGDIELISLIKKLFEETCGGSIELLKGRELEAFIQKFKYENQVKDISMEGGVINNA